MNSLQLLRKLALACVGLLAFTSAAISAPTRLAPRSWITTEPLVYPSSDASHPVVAVKDPSVVFHDGLWHIFATTAGSNGWGMGYINFASWDEAPQATTFHLDNNPNLAGYNAAPQVFYFRPQNKWYLIFQSQQPRFSTTTNIADPMSWSAPQDFFAGTPASVVEGWLDYWIICDDTHAYLFFPDDHGRLYRSRTTLANFPNGFDEPVVIMHEANPDDLFEGSCVYRIKDTNQFLLLVECIGKHRYYRAWVADSLDGAWTPLPGADSEETPFAGDANVRTSDGSLFWSEGVSHGELIREGSDETMTLDPENVRFLYQGFARGSNPPDYVLLPYHLALLESAPALPSLRTLLLFNEASGTTAADSTANTRHGTLVNGPTRVTGKGGNAVDLDGTDDHVSLPTGVVSSLIDFTLSTWVNLDAASPGSRIFDFGSGTTNYMFLTPANGATGTVRFAITTSGGGGEQQINGTSALPTGAWTHVAVTVAGNLGILYVNGVEVGRNESFTLTAMNLGETTQNWIGRSQYSDPYLNGRVDDFRIYGNALEASDVLALFNGTAGALAGPWANQDIGSVGLPGSAGSPGLPGNMGSPGDDIYVTASGGDIWGGSDEFHYVSRTWTGDGTLTARVNVAVADIWSKAGLMFRENLNANAPNAFLTVTPGTNGISFQTRSSTGGGTASNGVGAPAAPYWLKLQRTGNVFTPYHSLDGITWTQTAAPVTLSLPATCYVGFAATAHNNTLLTGAQFDNISLTATPPPAPAGLSATAGNAQVVLSWSAASGATGYTVKRATSSGGIYTTIASGITSPSYTDTGVTNGGTYYYVVAATNGNGVSPDSTEASATPGLQPNALQTLLLFNEASGTTAGDSTVNGRHGTLVNGPTRVTGKGGNAVDLDGTNDYVSLPTGVVSSLIDFTLSTWVNLDAASGWSRIFDFGTGTTSYMFLTPAAGSATGPVRFAITSGSGEQQINGTSPLPTGAWTHVAVTVTGNLGILYVNGVEVGRNAALTLTAASLGATTQNWIGRSQYSDPYLNGRVDDFRIYNTALAASDVLALFNGTAGALAGPWASQDIGSVGFPGSSGSIGDDIYVTASGGDIWGGSDEFHYVSRIWTGDGTLIARVNGVAATDAWAKAGLMFRENLNANARNALLTVTPGNGISFQSRSSTGGDTTFGNIGGLTAPYWLKLQRTGNVFTPSHSADGITWTQTAAPVTLSLPTTCYVGFAATAHNNTLLTAAQFDHISLTAAPPPAPVGLSATAGDTQVVLNWSATSGATGYNVMRATSSGGTYTPIIYGITSTSYTDTGLTNGDTYYYVVSAMSSGGESLPSSEASATPVTAYQQWKLSNGLSLSLPDTATPDNDGVPILLKYASGLTPGTPTTSPAVPSTVNNTLTLQFTRLNPAPVSYMVESSTDLSTWTTIATLPMASDTWTGPAAVAETGTGATRATTVTDTQSMDPGPRRFLRLRVDANAPPADPVSIAVMPMPGFNLGNTLESTWGYAPPTQALINSIADAGFKTLRVPCAWDWNSIDGTIKPEYMTQVANVVDWALARDMYVIINCHWDDGWFERDDFDTYKSDLNSKLINIWTQVANRFKWHDSDRLSFACSNEPGAWNQTQFNVLYQYYQNWITAMRANGGGNAVRWLIVQAGSPWYWPHLLNHGLNMPDDPAQKLMIETHTYEPGEFTVNGSDEPDGGRQMTYFWGSGYHVSNNLTHRNQTNGMEESFLQEEFAKLKTAFADRGYPVLIGEWAAQPKPELAELTGLYKEQNFRSVTYYNKFMNDTIRSFGFSGTYFAGQDDTFHSTTGAVLNQDKLNSILGTSALPPIPGL